MLRLIQLAAQPNHFAAQKVPVSSKIFTVKVGLGQVRFDNWEVRFNYINYVLRTVFLFNSVYDARPFQVKISIGNATKSLTRGCPQDGVLSAPLWNIAYDDVLGYREFNKVKHFVFADDTLLLVPGQFRDELLQKVKEIIKGMDLILKQLGLKLNHEKTVVIKFINYPRWLLGEEDWRLHELMIGNTCIEIQDKMKYLGVIIDNQLNFKSHVKYINAKVLKVINKLYFVFRNKYGYGNKARKIMTEGCVITLYQYAASIYYSSLQLKEVRSNSEKAKREGS